MKVYDCLTFFNELDLLELRMEAFNDIVDYFVINEATVTFQSNPKPLYYLENKERFKKFEHKIIHNVVDDTPTGDGWVTQLHQKNCTINALKECSDDDIIIYSDADEIANPNVLRKVIDEMFEQNKLFVFVDQDYCCYYLDAVIVGSPWPGTRLTNYGLLKQHSINEIRNTSTSFWKNHSDKIVSVRRERFGESTGWHFTNLGGVERIKMKLESFGHAEFNNDGVKNALSGRMNNLKDFVGRPGFDATKYKLDKSNCAEYVLNNLEKFKHLLCNDENKAN